MGEELHWATLWEGLADVVGDEDAVVQGERRVRWAELDERAARFAGALAAAGLGHGAAVGQYLHNSPEYVESWFGALKGRGVPININFRYLDEELAYLLDNADCQALVFHSSLGERVARVVAGAPRLKLLVEVDDGEGAGAVPAAVPYEELLAASAPVSRIERDPRDTTMLYTGGTTGMPKGVMGQVGGGVAALLAAVPPLVGLPPIGDVAGAVDAARRMAAEGSRLAGVCPPPLMHGVGLIFGMQTSLLLGGTLVLLAHRRFDPAELWDACELEGAALVAIVGDPFARPMLRALDDDPGRWDLSALRLVSSSGAMWSTEVKEGLVAHLSGATLLDFISSTEGLMGVSISGAGDVAPTGRFLPVPGVKVFTEDDREVAPGSGEAGIVGLSAGVPDAYYKDEEKSTATFREVGGVRYSFPGDWATVEADGTLNLLGRGSNCINTGGEKVFPEEVEEAVKRHPAVEDCLVFGVPDERFGQRIVAVASLGAGDADPDDLVAAARSVLASYKAPRQVVLVDQVPRTASGKADYAAARDLFTAAAPDDDA